MLSNRKFKIGYFADGPWSHRAFELLIQDNTISIEFIVPRSDSSDDTLANFSKHYNIPIYKKVKINSDEFYNLAQSYECDLFVSMSFNQIFKNKIINLPFLGTINCHAGKLPFYRGRNILNWALINDEKEFGITVHFVDTGIDTGDIIMQKTFPITDSDTYGSLLALAHESCAKILYESVKQLQSGCYERIKQSDIHEVGFYCGQRINGDEIINWNQSSRQIFNFIRAISKPGPLARTYINGKAIRINKARLIPNATDYIGITGQVIGKTEEGYVVKTSDNFIEIFEVETDSKIKIGDRLGV